MKRSASRSPNFETKVSFGLSNPPNVLAIINAQHPEHSDWQPILDLLRRTESPFTEDLDRVLRRFVESDRVFATMPLINWNRFSTTS